MSNMFLGVANTTYFTALSFPEEDNKKWMRMMGSVSRALDDLLLNECPKEISLPEFKQNLLSGANDVSDICEKLIELLFLPLRHYASIFGKNKGIDVSDLTNLELTMLGGFFSPKVEVYEGFIKLSTNCMNSTGSVVWDTIIDTFGIETASVLKIYNIETVEVKMISKQLTLNLIQNVSAVGIAIMISDFYVKKHSSLYESFERNQNEFWLKSS